MKFAENKKILLIAVFCMTLTVLLSTGVFRLAGSTNIVGLCVSMLLPCEEKGESSHFITLDAKNGIAEMLSINKDENSSENAVKINSLAFVPDDISLLMKEAEKTFQDSEKGGVIVDKTYGRESATQSEGNILVKNTTGRSLDISEVLKEKPALSKAKENEVSVLIFHTHTTECYQTLDKGEYLKSFSPRNNDDSQNMIRVGEEIAAQLKKQGIGVIHDTEIYDTKYSGAYDRSGEAVDRYLEKYPSIQVVIDVHRDAIQTSETTKVKPVTTINGKKAAQIMTITGCEGGDVTGFPHWEYNLNFALNLQKTAEEMYPTLMRPVFFCNRKYNMYKSKCSVLLEMGSDGNTLDEAAYSGRLIGDVLGVMLNKYLK